MDINCYAFEQDFVLDHFQEGEFDFMDSASEVVETEFFQFIGANKILEELAATYPSPRQKHEVPVWFYLASNISMRLHGAHSFNSFPYIVRCGGMLNAFGAKIGHKVKHPVTGDITLSCEGFNDKNIHDRETPCHPDYLRKFARTTKVQRLLEWFNRDVAQIFKRHKAFDPEGIFSGDASYLFVPDNKNYEGSSLMLFDEHNHPVSAEAHAGMTPQAATRCRWRRCYKLVSLLHTDRQQSFSLRIAMRIVPGQAHEDPILYDLVDEFVAAVGRGVIKRLLLDRGFIDGERMGRCKLQHGIDVLLPLRKDMAICKDVLGLLRLPEFQFTEVPLPPPPPPVAERLARAPERIRRREATRQKTLAALKAKQPPPDPAKILVKRETVALPHLTSFSTCPVPLTVIVNRETYADGRQHQWMLADTKPLAKNENPDGRRQEYHLRIPIEEGHRQLKCFWDLTKFTSQAFSLVVNQVVFVALAFNLLQIHLKRKGREELNRKTRPRVHAQLLPNNAWVIIYYLNCFALLTIDEYTELLLTLPKGNQDKILARTRKLKRELAAEFRNPRSP